MLDKTKTLLRDFREESGFDGNVIQSHSVGRTIYRNSKDKPVEGMKYLAKSLNEERSDALAKNESRRTLTCPITAQNKCVARSSIAVRCRVPIRRVRDAPNITAAAV